MSQCNKDDFYRNYMKLVSNYNELYNKYSNLEKICQDLQADIKKNERNSNDRKNWYLNFIISGDLT